MQGPDGVDRVQYLPPDRVLQSQHADPDKRQKFSRALEEEEEELEKHRKRRPHDQVELAAGSGEEAGAEATPDEAPPQNGETPEKQDETTKHIDVTA